MSREADRRTVIRATLAVAASRALGFPLALAVSMWLTRVLTREEFAFFGVLSSLAILFAMFAQAGFQTSVVRLLGEAEAGETEFRKPSIFYASVIVTFAFSVILAVLFYVAGRGLLPDIAAQSDWLFFLAALLLVSRSINTVAAQALRGIGRVGASANLSGQGEQGGGQNVFHGVRHMVQGEKGKVLDRGGGAGLGIEQLFNKGTGHVQRVDDF